MINRARLKKAEEAAKYKTGHNPVAIIMELDNGNYGYRDRIYRTWKALEQQFEIDGIEGPIIIDDVCHLSEEKYFKHCARPWIKQNLNGKK